MSVRNRELYKTVLSRDNGPMEFNLPLFLAALGLAFVLEALPWLLAPRRMREAFLFLLEMPDDKLRAWGAFLLVSGLFLTWAATSLIG